jgi:hypothetical protein
MAGSNPAQGIDVCVRPLQAQSLQLGARLTMKMKHGLQIRQSQSGYSRDVLTD